MHRLKELQEEFRTVFSGRGARLLDSLLPLLVFLIANPLTGLNVALWGSLTVATVVSVIRILRKEKFVYSLGGLGGVLLAALFLKISDSEAGFFVPGLISGVVTVLVCIVSVLLNRPLVAWTSYLARRWPLDWYWHPKVLPAYNEVTIVWAAAFAARLGLEFWLFQRDAVGALGASKVLLGWPYTVILLIATYLYGLWRLGHLGGPSIEEYKTGKQPPWEGQQRGF